MTDFAGKTFNKPVFVTYSCHCYSKGEQKGVPFSPQVGALINDGSKRREFCIERYGLSLVLPNIVRGILFSPHAYVWDTGYGNRLYHELIATPNVSAQHPYYLFMRVARDKLEDGPHVVKLAIESAYPIRPPDPTPHAAKNPLHMCEWLGKAWAPPQRVAVKNKSKKKKKKEEAQ